MRAFQLRGMQRLARIGQRLGEHPAHKKMAGTCKTGKGKNRFGKHRKQRRARMADGAIEHHRADEPFNNVSVYKRKVQGE